jgi:hypothetical protein
MTLRRLTFAMTLVCGLCVWGFAHSGGEPTPPHPAGEGGTHDEAAARYRANQSTHWKHVTVGNCSMSR